MYFFSDFDRNWFRVCLVVLVKLFEEVKVRSIIFIIKGC